ncbi:eCIS core domain-containing protein [Frigidibacter sp. ROC022]|uniref:eCIS core domain-containing protein n=1 Tax=Frigidibacter sp. ROC022 TaxID=2971796 RepID=UPI00215ADCEC|nr:DUF4157 domain-containing protein [Frigidibacter sp. ROC022]MCR8725837.1 DUF4157 domain-containing protein [Frigidibacter sp. ROC022]
MPDKPNPLLKDVEKLKGRKAKVKPLPEAPSGTRGVALPKDVKEMLETHFKTNLSKVRIHTGGNAADVGKKLGAKAFTVGNDVFFGKTGDAGDKKLLAHELTHVIQQGNGKIPPAQKGKALTSK